MRFIRAILKPLSFLPALCIMYMIYTFSAQEGATSSQLSYKVSYKIVETGGKLLGEDLQPWEIDSIATRFHGIVRKLAHMTEYFLLAISVSFPFYVYGLRGIWLMLVAGFICVAFACGDEYHQSFVAGRSPSKRDVLIDSFGVFWGIVLVRIICWTGSKTVFRPFTEEHINKKEQKKQERAARKQAKKAAKNGSQEDYINPNNYSSGYPNGYPYPDSSYYKEPPYSGQPYQEPYCNDPSYQEPFYNGSACTGDPYNGQPYNGQFYQGQPYNGQPYGGKPYNGYPPYDYPPYDYVPENMDDDHHVSDKLSEDMSFRKLMQDLKEQKKEARRGSRFGAGPDTAAETAGMEDEDDDLEITEIDLTT